MNIRLNSASQFSVHKHWKKTLCVVRKLVKQVSPPQTPHPPPHPLSPSLFPFMPGHFHMFPLLSYPSITFHSGQDSWLELKHIHSSAVHQIAPNTVILQLRWSSSGRGGRQKVSRRQSAETCQPHLLEHSAIWWPQLLWTQSLKVIKVKCHFLSQAAVFLSRTFIFWSLLISSKVESIHP